MAARDNTTKEQSNQQVHIEEGKPSPLRTGARRAHCCPGCGGEKEKEKEETFSVVSSSLHLAPYQMAAAAADKTTATSDKASCGFDKFKKYALCF